VRVDGPVTGAQASRLQMPCSRVVITASEDACAPVYICSELSLLITPTKSCSAAAAFSAGFRLREWKPKSTALSRAQQCDPGKVYVIVQSGTITEDSGCGGSEVFTAGQAFEEPIPRVHQVRNTGTEPAVLFATLISPPGTTTGDQYRRSSVWPTN